MRYTTYKIKGIVGGFYSCEQKTNTLVIYGKGAPNTPDDGCLSTAPGFTQENIDVFVPDYIGSGRSDGIFTPTNCINTFLQLYTELKNGTEALEVYYTKQIFLKYERIIFFGASFAGAYIPLLPKFNSEIKELGLIYPILDAQSAGSMPPEETNKQFLDVMRTQGYQHIYRGIENPIWDDHVENKDGLSPMDNMDALQDAKLFIGHGIHDTCINYKKSRLYFDRLLQKFPDSHDRFLIKIYDGDHSAKTGIPAVSDFLQWILKDSAPEIQ